MTDATDPSGSTDSSVPARNRASVLSDEGLPVVRAGNDDFSVEARGTFSSADATGYLPTPDSELLRVRLSSFEGPLDLLLFLIEGHALNILDIPLKVIVVEYLKVLDDMRELNLDVAGEFLVMAAQLAHIKSKLLLPRQERPREPDAEADPRADLVRRLLEYQRFKDAAQALDALPQLGRDAFARPPLPPQYDDVVDEPKDTGLQLAEVDPLDLIRLFDAILKRQQRLVVHEVLVERMSVGARINELVDVFTGTAATRVAAGVGAGSVFTFAELVDHFGPRTRRGVIVTFLSILEMARLKLVRLRQDPESLSIDVEPVLDNLAAEDDDGALKERLLAVDEFGPQGEANS
ncbi:MAG: segregation/condensation protein A [Deltaproteobacteria bacterium]|nr:segregation/condensation protein A [Deltaproteobacteria bacterium]